jgi:hypothetical protein
MNFFEIPKVKVRHPRLYTNHVGKRKRRVRLFEFLCSDAFGTSGGQESGIVTFVLICVSDCEIRERVFKRCTLSHIAGKHGRVSGSGVSFAESPSAKRSVPVQIWRVHSFDGGFDLGVAQLAHIEMPWRISRETHPAEENVAGSLHNALANHNALTMVCELARAGVRFDEGLSGLLELQEEWIVVIGNEEGDAAQQSDASHSNDLIRFIDLPVSIHKNVALYRKRS